MSEYPKFEFRCSHEFSDFIYQLLMSPEFIDLEISKSELLRKSCVLGLQIARHNPSIIKSIHEKDFLKVDK